MTPDECIEVVVTAPESQWLRELCRDLVEARMASSAHVLPEITSIYRWEGRVAEATEARAWVRTRRGQLEHVAAFVVDRHPYAIPSVVALPIIGGNARYLTWIRSESTLPSNPR